MLVSVCTIARNEEEYLPHLLEDITKQNYPAEQIEVVMVDSRSTITVLLQKIRETIRHLAGIRQSAVRPERSLSVWTRMDVFRRILFPRMWSVWKAERMSPGDQGQIFRRRIHRGRDCF